MQNSQYFVDIIKQHEALIYKITRVYADTREDEQDLYQEIVYQLWKSFPSFRKESKVSTWMYRVALNTSIAYLNREKRKGNLLPIHETLFNKPDERDAVQEERIEILYAHIKKLNTLEKGIILLWLEGKNYEEIAAITGFSSTNVGTRLGRIREKLSTSINQ
ncbi:MAG TPA: sigma-70 family RNA polymerase sigma factor [Puia sp.]